KRFVHQPMDPVKRSLRTGNYTRFLIIGQADRIQCGGKGAPMQAPPFRCPGEMPGAERFRQTELQRLLEQEGSAEIGALRHVEPAQSGGQVDRFAWAERRISVRDRS